MQDEAFAGSTEGESHGGAAVVVQHGLCLSRVSVSKTHSAAVASTGEVLLWEAQRVWEERTVEVPNGSGAAMVQCARDVHSHALLEQTRAASGRQPAKACLTSHESLALPAEELVHGRRRVAPRSQQVLLLPTCLIQAATRRTAATSDA